MLCMDHLLTGNNSDVESIPTYPDAGRYWDMVERHQINQFYTATAIKNIARMGDSFVNKYNRSSASS